MAGSEEQRPTQAEPTLVPARMLNEFVYCPRLFYMEWVQGEFADNADTIAGRWVHRRVDQPVGDLPEPVADLASSAATTDEVIHARALVLSSERLGLVARIDVLEAAGDRVTPVDYKRGSMPDIPSRAWEPDRIQIAAQALILRDNGYACDEGVVYYVESRQRVTVPITPELVEQTLTYLEACRDVARSSVPPRPLVDSPKCPRCSLVGLCLPDEVAMLAQAHPSGDVRRLYPARPDALPLYVQQQGVTVGKSEEVLQIRDRHGLLQEVRLIDCSHVAIFGNVQVTAQALRELLTRDIPVCHFSYGGWFYGITAPFSHRNVLLRQRQYAVAASAAASLNLARQFVRGKILNGRTLLRRNGDAIPASVLTRLQRYASRARRADSLDGLLGLEGSAARLYFTYFGGLLRPRSTADEAVMAFDFAARNRRPPKDPVNALLSYAYSLLVKDVTVTLLAVGFDPFLGFFHQPRYGRPALALDLMEEFRPVIADSVVLGVINQGEIDAGDFVRRGGSAALTPKGRKRFIEAYERRMDTLVTHPLFGYRVSYRRLLEVQARLLARYLMDEIPEYVPFRVR